MSVAMKQANFLLPEDLLEDLKQHVSNRQQSKIVAEAIGKELNRIKMKKTHEKCFEHGIKKIILPTLTDKINNSLIIL